MADDSASALDYVFPAPVDRPSADPDARCSQAVHTHLGLSLRVDMNRGRWPERRHWQRGTSAQLPSTRFRFGRRRRLK